VTEYATALLLLFGGGLSVLSGLGVLRLPDVLLRMHAASKVGVLGAAVILTSVAVFFQDAAITGRCLAAVVFILATTPLAAHLISRVVYQADEPLWRGTIRDELAETLRGPQRGTRTGDGARPAPPMG